MCAPRFNGLYRTLRTFDCPSNDSVPRIYDRLNFFFFFPCFAIISWIKTRMVVCCFSNFIFTGSNKTRKSSPGDTSSRKIVSQRCCIGFMVTTRSWVVYDASWFGAPTSPVMRFLGHSYEVSYCAPWSGGYGFTSLLQVSAVSSLLFLQFLFFIFIFLCKCSRKSEWRPSTTNGKCFYDFLCMLVSLWIFDFGGRDDE